MDTNLTDYEIADFLAFEIWGPTGFRCGDCGHEHGYHLACRGRMFECEACDHQQSVVADTVMADSKVPLRVWFVRAEFYQRGEVPTCRQLARAASISTSTAWGINHKFMASLAGQSAELFRLTLPCRKPSPKPPGPRAPEDLRAFWKALREGEAAAATAHVGEEVTVTGAVEHPPSALGERIARRLVLVHQAVCVKWLGRWVAHLVALWSAQPRPWLDALLARPPLPLARLSPWG